ncbi:MAG: HIT family protein [Lacipirellulaceae bacterium]
MSDTQPTPGETPRDVSERLWAPWRLAYVSGKQGAEQPLPEPRAWLPGSDRGCFVCRSAANHEDVDADRALLVVARDEHAVAVLNLYPYSNCHLLVSPRRHVATLAELTAEEHAAVSRWITHYVGVLGERVQAQGFNVGLNLGAVAGAGTPGHLHWHVVPRWPGDHNFMPVTAGVRVLPQSLDAAWGLLRSSGQWADGGGQ